MVREQEAKKNYKVTFKGFIGKFHVFYPCSIGHSQLNDQVYRNGIEKNMGKKCVCEHIYEKTEL